MQVRLGVEMSGVRLQAAGSMGAASAAVFAIQEKSELSLTLWGPAPACGFWVLLPTPLELGFCHRDSFFRVLGGGRVGQSQQHPLEEGQVAFVSLSMCGAVRGCWDWTPDATRLDKVGGAGQATFTAIISSASQETSFVQIGNRGPGGVVMC